MPAKCEPACELLRHALAALAYRAGKALRDAPAGFGSFKASADTRTPHEILAHMGDLFDWAASIVAGRETWRDAQPLDWDSEIRRFHAALKTFDDAIASGEPPQAFLEKLLQGPVADALTHTGQLTMLRRLAGAPVRGENYFIASIAAGAVGADQPEPRKEFE